MKCPSRAVGELKCDLEAGHIGPHMDRAALIAWTAGPSPNEPWTTQAEAVRRDKPGDKHE